MSFQIVDQLSPDMGLQTSADLSATSWWHNRQCQRCHRMCDATVCRRPWPPVPQWPPVPVWPPVVFQQNPFATSVVAQGAFTPGAIFDNTLGAQGLQGQAGFQTGYGGQF